MSTINKNDVSRFFSDISSKHIRPTTYIKKKVETDAYAQVLEYGAQQATEHGNYSFVYRILEAISETTYYKPTLLWFCDLMGFEYRLDGDNRIRFSHKEYLQSRKRKMSRAKPLCVQVNLSDPKIHGTRDSVIKPEIKKRKKKNSTDYIDAMDRRVSGSYGSAR